MVKPSASDERPPRSALKGDAAREARLAAALRANLRRRKAQARAASAKPAAGEGGQ